MATAITGLLRLGIWSFHLNGNGALGYFIHLFVERWVTWRIITPAEFVCLGLSPWSPKTTFPLTVAFTADCLYCFMYFVRVLIFLLFWQRDSFICYYCHYNCFYFKRLMC